MKEENYGQWGVRVHVEMVKPKWSMNDKLFHWSIEIVYLALNFLLIYGSSTSRNLSRKCQFRISRRRYLATWSTHLSLLPGRERALMRRERWERINLISRDFLDSQGKEKAKRSIVKNDSELLSALIKPESHTHFQREFKPFMIMDELYERDQKTKPCVFYNYLFSPKKRSLQSPRECTRGFETLVKHIFNIISCITETNYILPGSRRLQDQWSWRAAEVEGNRSEWRQLG